MKSDGTLPIFCGLTINKKRVSFNIKASVTPKIWDAGTSRASGKSREATDLNRIIDKYIMLLHEKHDEIFNRDGIVDAEELKNCILGNTSLTNGTPIYLLQIYKKHNDDMEKMVPFFNLSNSHELYKKHNFSSYKNILDNLSEISVHINHTTDVTKLIPFLQSASRNLTFNIFGNIGNAANGTELLSFFDQLPSPKYILCAYTKIISLQSNFENNFSYKIAVHFPIDMQKWKHSIQFLLNQKLPFEYIFGVTSEDNCQQAEQLIEEFEIEKHQLKPVFTGTNIEFFEENVFFTKADVLSAGVSIKDVFANQSMNIYDFGKINIMPNGDVYANVNHPALGNIGMHSIHEIVQNKVDEGISWLRIRNQEPCNNCIYQWLCPPPSDYEIDISRPILCHVK